MHIEYIATKRPRCACEPGSSGQAQPSSSDSAQPSSSNPAQQSQTPSSLSGQKERLPPSEVEGYLSSLEGKIHTGPATQLLCAASTWAYSDLKTFASMMCHRGLYGEFVGINVTNEVTFVNTTAYLFLSENKELAILTFRGTQMTDLVNWLANSTTEQEPQEEGGIHGGFLTAGIVVLPVLKRLLLPWSLGSTESLAEGLLWMGEKSCYPDDVFPASLEQAVLERLLERDGLLERLEKWRPEDKTRWPRLKEMVEAKEGIARERLDQLHQLAEQMKKDNRTTDRDLNRALYITGHSAGGAIASMAGAVLHLDPRLAPIRSKLRSVYTFGAPMFADNTLAVILEKELGQQTFRHRYKNDVVPLLPSRLQGKYKHFGCAYVSSNKGVWVRDVSEDKQTFGSLLSNIIGLVAFAKERVNILQWIPLPFSWADHSPLRYMKTSQAPRAGWEILGDEVGQMLQDVPMVTTLSKAVGEKLDEKMRPLVERFTDFESRLEAKGF